MDEYVSKPLDPDRLLKAIEKLLDQPRSASSESPLAETETPRTQIPAPVAGSDSPPLEIDAVLERCMGNVETVRMILDEFEQEAVADLAKIRQHVEHGDCDETARVAHALKGAAGILAANALSDIAFSVERMGRSGALTDSSACWID